MLTKITASHIASTSVIHLEKMQAILEYFVQQYTEGSEGSEGSEGTSKDKQHVILLQATTACPEMFRDKIDQWETHRRLVDGAQESSVSTAKTAEYDEFEFIEPKEL